MNRDTTRLTVAKYLEENGEANIETIAKETGVSIKAIRIMIKKKSVTLSPEHNITDFESKVKEQYNNGVKISQIASSLDATMRKVHNAIISLNALGQVSLRRREAIKEKNKVTYIRVLRGKHYDQRGYLLPESQGTTMYANIWDGKDFVKIQVWPQFIEEIRRATA